MIVLPYEMMPYRITDACIRPYGNLARTLAEFLKRSNEHNFYRTIYQLQGPPIGR